MTNEFQDFLIGAGVNLAVAVVIVRFIYYPLTQDKTYVFAFLVFNTVIFFVMSMLTSIELSLGVGFGLFAIFTVLRYRTEEIPIREITYLFAIMALPVMNASFASGHDLDRLAVANVAIVGLLYILEREWGFQFEGKTRVTYERIELITAANYDLLLDDLRARTGLPVTRVEVGRVNFLRDTAELTVHYHVAPPGTPEDRQRRDAALRPAFAAAPTHESDQ